MILFAQMFQNSDLIILRSWLAIAKEALVFLLSFEMIPKMFCNEGKDDMFTSLVFQQLVLDFLLSRLWIIFP